MHEAQRIVGEASRLVHFFGDPACENVPLGKDVLGGKGASLAAMSCAALPVPPGFTISIPCCRYYHEQDSRGSLREPASRSRSEQRLWPAGLERELKANMVRLERLTGKQFGRGADPLLVSVRSGAAASMPGMMDTILNCGLHPAMAAEVPDEDHFWTVYAQFIRQFALTVADIPRSSFDRPADKIGQPAGFAKDLAKAYIELYERESGRAFPVTAWGTLCECINAVFASWNNERARIYRKAHGLEKLEGTAVNVQSMFNSQVSGIAFTANPAKPTAEEIVIESSYGLGESIVSGDVTPDRFVLDYKSLAINERTLGHKDHVMTGLGKEGDAPPFDPTASSLTDDQITELGRLALKVEAHFGFPVDIEWGLADGRFTLLQSRAIRGLDVTRDAEVGRQEEIERLKCLVSESRQKDKVWIVHNLAETLRTPTPLTWDIIRGFMSGNGGFGQMYKDLGYRPSRRVCETGFLELICGQIYADSDRASELFWESMPFAYDHQDLLADPRLLETAPTKFEAERADEKFLLRLPGNLLAMFRSHGTMKRARRDAIKVFEEVELPWFHEYIVKKMEQDLEELSTQEVIAELHDRIQRVLTDFGKESLKPGFFGGCARLELEAKLTQLLGRVEGEKLVRSLISGLTGDTTVEQNAMLFRVSQGVETMDAFLQSYGHRCAGEMELANARWREDDAFLRQIVEKQETTEEHSPASLHKRNQERREQAMRELPDVLVEWGGSFMREDIEGLAVEAQKLLPYRETGKHHLMMGYALIRTAILELGRRWELDKEVFFLQLDELEQFENDRDRLVQEIATRKVRWRSAQLLDLPEGISSDNLDELGLPRQIDAASELEAQSLAAGVVTGTAHIIFNPSDATDLGDDCILVCPSTDPGWTALFTTIKGLIVERGGVLSHGAITARDFSIPAVACPDTTQIIKNGATVRVDGDRGHISIIEDE
jgi:pyruvate,water dikinase